jgi:hypothetical protein
MTTGTTCGNCGTENALGEDYCTKCGKPLTRAGEQALRESDRAQDQGGVLGSDPVDGPAPGDTSGNLSGPTASQMPPR